MVELVETPTSSTKTAVKARIAPKTKPLCSMKITRTSLFMMKKIQISMPIMPRRLSTKEKGNNIK